MNKWQNGGKMRETGRESERDRRERERERRVCILYRIAGGWKVVKQVKDHLPE